MKTKSLLFTISMVYLFTACIPDEVVNHHIPIDDNNKATVFTADMSDYSSRTILIDKADGKGKALLWSKGDKIRVSDGQTEAVYTTDDEGKSVAEFINESASLNATATLYTAFYPETLSSSTLLLPAVQTYVENGMSHFPMMAVSNTKQLNFRNLCGVICLRIKTNSDAAIALNKIILSSPDAGLSGKFTIDEYKAVVTDENTDLTLQCKEGVQLSDQHYTDFYLYLPDGKYKTMNLTLAGTDGSEIKLVSNGAITVIRSSITQISLILDTTEYSGSLEDLPIIDDGTGFVGTTIRDSSDGIFSITDENVEQATR